MDLKVTKDWVLNTSTKTWPRYFTRFKASKNASKHNLVGFLSSIVSSEILSFYILRRKSAFTMIGKSNCMLGIVITKQNPSCSKINNNYCFHIHLRQMSHKMDVQGSVDLSIRADNGSRNKLS